MKDLCNEVKSFVEKAYNNTSNELLFHDWNLKKQQLNSANELIDETATLSEDEKGLILSVTLLTDIRFTGNPDKDTDEEIATDFLKKLAAPEGKLKAIVNTLKQVNSDATPNTRIEEIIQDLRYSFVSDKNYPILSELWRTEKEQLENREISSNEWRKEQLNFLRLDHNYYTDYAKDNWGSRKKKNLKKIVKQKKKGRKLARKEKLKAKYKGQIPDRGIQTLYRVTLRNHIKLSDIADTKANILLSVNAIIISLALANLIPKLDNPSNDYLIYPTFIFIIFSIVSMIMSILATRPNVTSGEFSDGDVNTKKVNLLFFGNFHKMELSKYQWAMKELIKDKDYIYSSLTKDLYYLGVVLEKKYSILRWTYTVFMVGMILSVIAFGIALKYFGPDRVLELPDLPQ
jgi:hypothetical protein